MLAACEQNPFAAYGPMCAEPCAAGREPVPCADELRPGPVDCYEAIGGAGCCPAAPADEHGRRIVGRVGAPPPPCAPGSAGYRMAVRSAEILANHVKIVAV